MTILVERPKAGDWYTPKDYGWFIKFAAIDQERLMRSSTGIQRLVLDALMMGRKPVLTICQTDNKFIGYGIIIDNTDQGSGHIRLEAWSNRYTLDGVYGDGGAALAKRYGLRY